MKKLPLRLMIPVIAGCGLFLITVMEIFSSCKKNDATAYWYANWSCGSQQCASVMGASRGSEGPFCTQAACQSWGNQIIPGGYNCADAANTQPILGGTPPNGKCFD